MHSVPAPPEWQAKRKSDRPPKPDRRTRLKRLADDEVSPDWPELLAGTRIAGWLLDVGPCLHGGNGPTALTHSEIRAWQQNTRTRLTAWECQTLRHLSRAYVSELLEGESPDRPAPYIDEENAETARRARMRRKALSFREEMRAAAENWENE